MRFDVDVQYEMNQYCSIWSKLWISHNLRTAAKWKYCITPLRVIAVPSQVPSPLSPQWSITRKCVRENCDSIIDERIQRQPSTWRLNLKDVTVKDKNRIECGDVISTLGSYLCTLNSIIRQFHTWPTWPFFVMLGGSTMRSWEVRVAVPTSIWVPAWAPALDLQLLQSCSYRETPW